jgi:hypothetical protein
MIIIKDDWDPLLIECFKQLIKFEVLTKLTYYRDTFGGFIRNHRLFATYFVKQDQNILHELYIYKLTCDNYNDIYIRLKN